MERDPIVAEALETRFWPFVHKTDGCWLWKRSVDTNGYGSIMIRGKKHLVHRLSYSLVHGEIPEGEGYHGACILHICDTPRCVNPNHLRIGTQQDNIADRDAKGRLNHPHGASHPMAKLSPAQIEEIRHSNEPGRIIGPRYGVHQTTIDRIRRGATWRAA